VWTAPFGLLACKIIDNLKMRTPTLATTKSLPTETEILFIYFLTAFGQHFASILFY